MDFRQIDKKVQNELMAKKIFAEKIAARNLARAKSIPAYRQLDELERSISLEFSKSASSSPEYKKLKQNLKVVREAKNNILNKLKLKESDLLPKYSCTKCNDTGFVGGVVCSCYKKKRNEELIKAFGLITDENCSFENMKFDIYKNAKQLENIKNLSKALQKWLNNYPNNEKNNIIISGKTGVGKTYIANCLANEFLKKNISVCFISAFDLNESFLKYHTSFDKEKASWFEPFVEADVLFIDDLGTEPMLNNVTKNYLFLLLSERERFGRPVIVTTNIMPDDILEKYDERVFSRLFNKRNLQLYLIDGEDLRIKN